MEIAGTRAGPGTDAKRRLGAFLIAAAVVATAFNDLRPLLPVGELAPTAVIYAFPLLLLYILTEPGRVTLPVLPTVLTLALFVVILAGIAANFAEISGASFKGRGGIGRVATQGMSVVLGLLVCVMFYNFARRGFLEAMSRGARITLLIMACVGLLELGSWYHLPGLEQAYEALSLVIHAESGPVYPQRLRSTAFEVSYAGVVLAFAFPFAIMGLPRGDRRRVLYVVLVLLLVSLSKSRTAMLVIGCQVLFLAWFSVRGRFDRIMHALTLGVFAAILVALSPGPRETLGTAVVNLALYGNPAGAARAAEENVSNVTRLAGISAGMSMFRDRPLLGVGLGQYGFNYANHVKAADYRSWEVRRYVTSAETEWPPTFSLHVRILAELGLLGYAIWCALLLPVLLRALRGIDLDTPTGRARLAVAQTLAGWLLLGMSIDSFNFFGGWIALGAGLALPAAARSAAAPPPLRGWHDLLAPSPAP